jgi:hypothetical protein
MYIVANKKQNMLQAFPGPFSHRFSEFRPMISTLCQDFT